MARITNLNRNEGNTSILNYIEEDLDIQKKTFTKWINLFLFEEEIKVEDLFIYLSKEDKLLHFCEAVFNVNLDVPSYMFQAFDFLNSKINLKIKQIQSILQGEPNSILELIWAIFLFKTQEIKVGGPISLNFEEVLLNWCQSRIRKYYPIIIIQDLSASWRNGLGFNALIHSYRPELINNFLMLSPQNAQFNLNYAFEVAFLHFNIPRLLDVEDVDTDRPDKKSIMLYLTIYYEVLSLSEDQKITFELEKDYDRVSETMNLNPSHFSLKNRSDLSKKWSYLPNTSCLNAPQFQEDIVQRTSLDELKSSVAALKLNHNINPSEIKLPKVTQANEDKTSKSIIIEEIEIIRGEFETLGIYIRQGNSEDEVLSPDDSFFIEKIVKGSVAHRNGKLKVGMKLIEINSQPLLGISYYEALRFLRKSGKEVILLVSREVEDGDLLDEASNQNSPKLIVYDSYNETLKQKIFAQEDVKKKLEMETLILQDLVEKIEMAEQEDLIQLQLEQANFLDEEEEFHEREEMVRNRAETYECECCFRDDVISADIVTCIEGHLFCADCVKKATEVAFGEGNSNFNCLAECKSHFKVEVLKDILPSNMYDKIQQKIQENDIIKADIEGFCFCPHCNYGEILMDDEVIFHCKLCFKISCRFCKKDDHSPFTCDEIKDKEETSARVGIETKMTSALIRECYNCKKSFIKLDGCNKMTCVCGALMCYICKKPIKDYTHFNENSIEIPSTSQGPQKCPLWSNNQELHIEAVTQAANNATAEAEIGNPELNFETSAFLQGLV